MAETYATSLGPVFATHHRYADVGGRQIFYREAGDPRAPAVILLHGAPASSFMFRDLIPLLAGSYHVIAPDYLGFGLSDAPSVEEFDYSFDALAECVEALLGLLGLTRYSIYVQDYGAPVGWRLALRRPETIAAVITQNGNAYAEGLVPSSWEPLWAYAADPNPGERLAAVGAVSRFRTGPPPSMLRDSTAL